MAKSSQQKSLPASQALPAAQPTIIVVDFLPETLREKSLSDIEEMAAYLQTPNPTWVDISGPHPQRDYNRFGEMVGLHPLTLEDILNMDQRPKTEDFPNYVLIVLKKPTYDKEEACLGLEQVSIILTTTTVFSLHQRVPKPTSAIRSRMVSEQERIRKLGTDYLAYVIVDSIVDEYFATMDAMADETQELETELTDSPSPETMQRIHSLKQDVIVLRRSVWPLREVVTGLTKTTSPLFDEGLKIYLKDLGDHIVQVVELIDLHREILSGMLDFYLSTMTHRSNQIMKTLTMIASIFIPLTVITGIYGMNFVHMPELHWRYGYPATLTLMVIVAASMLWFFKRRKWF